MKPTTLCDTANSDVSVADSISCQYISNHYHIQAENDYVPKNDAPETVLELYADQHLSLDESLKYDIACSVPSPPEPPPPAHTLSATPSAHTLSATPSAHALSATPSAHTLSATPSAPPSAHTLSATPSAHTLSATPSAHTLSATPSAHTLSATPSAHTLSATPSAHTLSATPSAHTLSAKASTRQSAAIPVHVCPDYIADECRTKCRRLHICLPYILADACKVKVQFLSKL